VAEALTLAEKLTAALTADLWTQQQSSIRFGIGRDQYSYTSFMVCIVFHPMSLNHEENIESIQLFLVRLFSNLHKHHKA
jgi:hypothetical protein